MLEQIYELAQQYKYGNILPADFYSQLKDLLSTPVSEKKNPLEKEPDMIGGY